MDPSLPYPRLWAVGAVTAVLGLVLPFNGVFSLPGVLLLAVAAGRTAAWGRDTSRISLVCAWAVPGAATLLTLAPLALLLGGLESVNDPLALLMGALWFGLLALVVWVIFGIAVLVEVERRRRFDRAPVHVGG